MPDLAPHAATFFVVLFHLSNLFAFVSFLLRDQMKLRLLMGLSLAMQAAYYFTIPGGPLFDSLFWKVVSFIANLGVILIILKDNLDVGIPTYLRNLFVRLKVLTPGQFRKLVAQTTRVEGHRQAILSEGMRPDRLYFLLEGEAHVIKNRQSTTIKAGTFLGEVAFLSDLPASATVILNPGAVAVSWRSEALHALMRKDAFIDIAMRGFFNHDLAMKVARSAPVVPRSYLASAASN